MHPRCDADTILMWREPAADVHENAEQEAMAHVHYKHEFIAGLSGSAPPSCWGTSKD